MVNSRLQTALIFTYKSLTTKPHQTFVMKKIINDKTNSFTFSDDKRTVSLVDGCWGTLYGNIEIDSLSETICRWNVKISNIKYDGYAPYIML